MATAKAIDIESVRFSAPDLIMMRDFLVDFGMHPVADTGDGILRMRGTGDAPFVHETVPGPAGFVGLTLRVASITDLERLAQADGAQIEDANCPGGGHKVALRDPDGFLVEVIAGRARVPMLPHGSRAPWNVIASRGRPGAAKRLAAGPANVVRLGHVVLGVSDVNTTWRWWEARFGLLMSDEVRAPNDNIAAVFVRCDRGDEPADHHTLNFAAMPGAPAAFHHAAFEVADLDDLMAGSQYLENKGHRHDWGVGRHILGSQVFDYWRDPWGQRVEHWTDGDVFDASVPANVTDLPTMMGHQWGPAAPADFAG